MIWKTLEILHSEHDDDLLNVDLHMIQAWIVVSTSAIFYKVSIVLFHKYAGENISV